MAAVWVWWAAGLYIVWQGFPEPVLIGFAALAAAALAGEAPRTVLAGVLVGLAAATKQFGLGLIPFLPLGRGGWKAVVAAGVTWLVVVVPFALWHPDRFFEGALFSLVREPARDYAFNVLNWPGLSIDPPLVLVFVISLAFGWLCQRRQDSPVGAWLAGSVGLFLVAFALNRIAFVNYFAIPMALMLFLILAYAARRPAEAEADLDAEAGDDGSRLAHLPGDDRQEQDRHVLERVEEPALGRVHEDDDPVDPHGTERQADGDADGERDPPRAVSDAHKREREERRLEQDQRRGPLVEAAEREEREDPDDRVARDGPGDERRPEQAEGDERPGHGRRPEAPDGPGRDAERDRPPEERRQDGERDGQQQDIGRVQHVAHPDGIRTGELVRLVEGATGEPSVRGVHVQVEIDGAVAVEVGLGGRVQQVGDREQHDRDRDDRQERAHPGRDALRRRASWRSVAARPRSAAWFQTASRCSLAPGDRGSPRYEGWGCPPDSGHRDHGSGRSIRRMTSSRPPVRVAVAAAVVAGTLGWIGLVAIAAQLAAATPSNLGFDLELLLEAGRDIASGQTPYAAELLSGTAPTATHLFYSYPPPVAQAFALVAFLPSSIALVAWSLAAIAGLLAVAEGLRRRYAPDRPRIEVLIVTAAVAPLTLPLAVGLLFGNFDVLFPLLYGAMLLAVVAPSRATTVLGGAALVVASLKIHPASMGLWFLVRAVRERRDGETPGAVRRVLVAAIAIGLVVLVAQRRARWARGLWADYALVDPGRHPRRHRRSAQRGHRGADRRRARWR